MSFFLEKHMKRWMGALLGVWLLVACDQDITGTYTKEEKSPDGQALSISLELKDGEQAVLTMKGDANNLMSASGTYHVEGDKVTVSIQGNPEVFTLDGDKLTGNAMGETLVLVKE